LNKIKEQLDNDLNKHLKWRENITKKGLLKKPKIDIKGRDIKSNLPSYEETSKREDYVLGFIKSRFDFMNGKIVEDLQLPVSNQDSQRMLEIYYLCFSFFVFLNMEQ
jgi:hypothetical protein